MSLQSKLVRILVSMLVLFFLVVATLGLLWVFEIITLPELRDYSVKAGAAVLIIAAASSLVSFVLSLNRRQ